MSVSIGSAGAVTIRYDDRDPAARDAAERIEKYVQNLERKSKWRLSWQWWITGLGPFFFAAVVLNVVMYFVRPTFAQWVVGAGVLLLDVFGLIRAFRTPLPDPPGVSGYTREELLALQPPATSWWTKTQALTGLAAVALTLVSVVLTLLFRR